jgi:hypothetical protein
VAKIFCAVSILTVAPATRPSTNSHSEVRAECTCSRNTMQKRTCVCEISECPPNGILPRASSLGTPMYPDPVSGGKQFLLLEIYSMRKTHFHALPGEEMSGVEKTLEPFENVWIQRLEVGSGFLDTENGSLR